MGTRLLVPACCQLAIIACMMMRSTAAMAWRYGDIQPWVVARFEPHSVVMGDRVYNYRLFRPDGAPSARADTDSGHDEPPAPGGSVPQAAKKWPVLLWLHGEGEKGDDNRSQMKWLEMLFYQNGGDAAMFVVAPQQPRDAQGWHPANSSADDPLTIAVKALDDAMAKFPLDEDRVYLSGVSSGGNACWRLACRYPDRFAAVAPLASSGGAGEAVEKLVKVPVWAFHSRTDKAPNSAGVAASVRALVARGGHAWLTETEPVFDDIKRELDNHNCWTRAFEEHRLADWLLQQRRGSPILAPGESRWAWWQAPMWIGAVTLLAVAWWRERRRRAAARRKAATATKETIRRPT